ncbi:hypothetical protein LTR17_002592 [Elasticomyces elasticus]|nr:hypothetical protein LTR17_002592 [Elasticomyces elasticus]
MSCEAPPPYTALEAPQPSMTTIVHRRHALDVGSKGKAVLGELLNVRSDAVKLKTTASYDDMWYILRAQAEHCFHIEHGIPEKMWYDGLTLVFNDQQVHIEDEDTWLECRQLLDTRTDGALWYAFAIGHKQSKDRVVGYKGHNSAFKCGFRRLHVIVDGLGELICGSSNRERHCNNSVSCQKI